eukprot:TRINITY_DN6031_c0_g1_i1.p1 TRINITY_DN6031_c0_g1~~TRINITY_DN6031_c0_g1_i1.p1  ORF type:complete len:268 (-),score=13.68 TRINITY_DN6031_c0_g1_i1:74-877(-)
MGNTPSESGQYFKCKYCQRTLLGIDSFSQLKHKENYYEFCDKYGHPEYYRSKSGHAVDGEYICKACWLLYTNDYEWKTRVFYECVFTNLGQGCEYKYTVGLETSTTWSVGLAMDLGAMVAINAALSLAAKVSANLAASAGGWFIPSIKANGEIEAQGHAHAGFGVAGRSGIGISGGYETASKAMTKKECVTKIHSADNDIVVVFQQVVSFAKVPKEPLPEQCGTYYVASLRTYRQPLNSGIEIQVGSLFSQKDIDSLLENGKLRLLN